MTPRLAEPLHVCSTPREIDARSHRKHRARKQRCYGGVALAVFVGKYFVVRLSTTKTTKILPPEKYPLYGAASEPVGYTPDYAVL